MAMVIERFLCLSFHDVNFPLRSNGHAVLSSAEELGYLGGWRSIKFKLAKNSMQSSLELFLRFW